MEESKLTVYYRRGAYKAALPQVFLRGKWLERAGFSAGDKSTMNASVRSVVVTKGNLD